MSERATGGAEITVFEGEVVPELRRRARRATCVQEEGPEGWSRSDADPEALLAVFSALRLKPGLALRAYQFRSGGNGNGFVYALPADAAFPEPEDCPESSFSPVRGVELARPRPLAALEDVMDAVEGDRSPWSYLCASILERELSELGALWHGAAWSDEFVVERDPWAENEAERPGSPAGVLAPVDSWSWEEDAPDDWRPKVALGPDGTAVTFYTYTMFDTERLTRYVDRFAGESYRFRTETVVIGYGTARAVH